MEFVQVKEEPIVDLTQDSGGEINKDIQKEGDPKICKNSSTYPLIADEPFDNRNSTQLMEEPEETLVLTSRISVRNADKSLEQAFDEIRKGGSLSLVASHYGLSEDLIYETIVSRNVTHQMDILTSYEEVRLVKWIVRSNKRNSMVMRRNLLDRVGKMKKVLKITPFFARSKFGRMWYEYFLRNNPEIVENDGFLLPSVKPKKHEPEDLVSYGLKQAVVVLSDCRKQNNILHSLQSKVSLPSHLREDVFNVEIKPEESKVFFPKNSYSQPIVNNSSLRVEDDKNSLSDGEASISERSENNDPDYMVKKARKFVKPIRRKEIKTKLGDLNLRPQCEKCKKTFCNKYKLQRHLFTHIPKELYTVSCYKCSKSFPSKYHFLVHLKIAHTDNNHTCSECGNVFKLQTSLRRHFMKVHYTSGETADPSSFDCDICSKSFKHKNSLKTHIMYGHLKEGKRRHSCNICNKKFIKSSLMIRHKTRHCKVKPLLCVNCEKSFSRKYLLMRHEEKCVKHNKSDTNDECTKLCQEFMDEIVLD